MNTITTLTYEEFQSMVYSHMHEDINIGQAVNSIEVLQVDFADYPMFDDGIPA